MKIGLILPGFSASESDWCIPALLDLVRCLSLRAEVHVYPLRYPPVRQPYRVGGAIVHPQAGGTVGKVRRAALIARCATTLIAEHRRGRFDVLHAFWSDEPGVVAVTTGAALGVPAIVSLAGGELIGFHDIGYGGQLSVANRWMTTIALHRAARVTAGSSYLAAIASRWGASERLSVLPLGVDTGLFSPSVTLGEPETVTFDPAQMNVLNVASLVPVKGHINLLTALPGVISEVPNLKLHIVGDGPLLPELRGLTAALGFAEHVTFHCTVSHDSLPSFYRAADFCVLPSRHEAQGMVTLEAAACGRLTVGTRVGIVPDLGPAAVTVPLDDLRALIDALIKVAGNKRLRTELGLRSLKAARSRYTVEHAVDDLIALYRSVTAEQPGGALTREAG